MADVFLSYARVDMEIAGRVKAGLEAAGLSVFFDVEGLDGGDVFPDVLDREVKAAGAVVSLWSPHSLSRPWVKQECSIGLKRKCLIPVAIERLGDLDVPVAFEGLQVVDFTGFHGETGTPEWQNLMRALARTLKRPELVALPERPAPAVRRPKITTEPVSAKPVPIGWIVGGVAAAGLALLLPSMMSSGFFTGGGGAEIETAPAVEETAEVAPVFEAPPAGVTEVQPGEPCGDLTALIYFEFDKATLNDEAQSILEEALTRGFDCELIEVRIEAHDDLTNSPSYAEALSERRAAAVAEFLRGRGGVSAELVSSIGYGSSQPWQPGQRTPRNRRASVYFDYENPPDP